MHLLIKTFTKLCSSDKKELSTPRSSQMMKKRYAIQFKNLPKNLYKIRTHKANLAF